MKFSHNSGRTIELCKLTQQLTYGSMFGVPRTKINDLIIKDTRQMVARLVGREPMVIVPARKLAEGYTETSPSAQAAWGPWEYLPKITCWATFSSKPVRKEREDCSMVVVLWFQEIWAMPIDPDNLKQMQTIDWEEWAEDVSD